MSMLKTQGMFCRTCGLAVLRDMAAGTLLLGWWSPLSLIATPITLLLNLSTWSGLRRLPQPSGGWRHPLDAGRPLFRRPIALTALGVLAALATTVIVVNATRGGEERPRPTQLTAGQCVANSASWPEQDLALVDCRDSDADAVVHLPDSRGRCLVTEFPTRRTGASYAVDGTYTADGKPMCLTVFSESNY
ncbi:hypothetical protein [Streptomyces flavofungini]|uniref:hypothetical protein n=1 Tax=Streptomyces flavofungini TaxID=68200 RepID=UPI0025B1257C|nr:hypothetical protein [Streptomyces flavofungini]WJV46461.1 hypothetical protein QUY26_13505 [Streptomyces flavofungini]